ncbi:MAG: helix-turn-helix domain-containing protein [Coriobacteriales bacterium]|jgi:excisionase family DNA binding protein
MMIWKEDVKPVPVKMGRLISSATVAAYLGVSERTVYRMAKSGKLEPIHIKSKIYFSRKQVTGV